MAAPGASPPPLTTSATPPVATSRRVVPRCPRDFQELEYEEEEGGFDQLHKIDWVCPQCQETFHYCEQNGNQLTPFEDLHGTCAHCDRLPIDH